MPDMVVLPDGTDATKLVQEAEKFLTENTFAKYDV
jgi:hypothetical protein